MDRQLTLPEKRTKLESVFYHKMIAMSENKEQPKEETAIPETTAPENQTPGAEGEKKKKVSLAEFKMKSFVTNVKVDQMQFLKTAGG